MRVARAVVAVVLFTLVVACGGAPEPPAPAAATPEPTKPEEGARMLRPARTIPLREEGGEPRSGLPEGHPPVGDAASAPSTLEPPPPGSGTGKAGLRWTEPGSWIPEPPASAMRRAQYRVPGPGGDAELVVFYFGPGQGGTAEDNAVRWAEQFSQPDGSSPVEAMKVHRLEGSAVPVTMVEVTGTYEGGMTMTAEPAVPRPGHMLLGGIAEGPDAPWFFKLTGPEATVRGERQAFEQMLRSLEVGG